MKGVWLIGFLLLAGYGYAQTELTGVTVTREGKPLEGVILTLSTGAKESLGYAISDAKGAFVLSVDPEAGPLDLSVAFLGYEKQQLHLENRSQRLTIRLNQKDVELKQVAIKADLIWRREDTLVYNVDALKDQQDRTIGDLLKKLPGIEVSQGGSIKYNGEAINKFYIEGLDLLEKRYGIATNNVPVDAVQNVEVIENHQPVKSFKGVFESDQAAINLKLKGSKLSRPVGNAEIGTGADEDDLLWLANLFALQAGKERQTMVLYKTNNAGVNLLDEMNVMNLQSNELSSDRVSTDKSIFNENPFSEMQLDYKRYLFNETHIASVNHLEKLTEDSQLRFNLNYQHDVRDEKVAQSSSYYLEDSVLDIHEQTWLEKTSNILDASVSYNGNTADFYLNEVISAKFKWDKIGSDVTSDGRINQRYETPDYELSNDFQLVKKIKDRLWSFTSLVQYSSQPQNLEVAIDSLTGEAKQFVHYTGLYTTNSTFYTFGKGPSNFTVRLIAEGSFESLKSKLEHSEWVDSIRNHLHTDQYSITLHPLYSYQGSRINLTADAEIKQLWMRVDDRQYRQEKTTPHFFFQPGVKLKYTFNPYWNATVSYRFRKRIGDLFDLAPSYLLSSYRNLSIKSGVLSKRKTHSGSIRVNYRNPLTTLFFNASLSYAHTERNLLSEQWFRGIQSISGNLQKDNELDTWIWNGYIGKYISSLQANISLRSSYTYSKSEKIQQKHLYPVKSRTWMILPEASIRPAKTFNLSYRLQYLLSKLGIDSVDGTTHTSDNSQLSQTLKLYYFLKKWEFSLQGEHIYNKIAEGVTSGSFFMDFGIKLATKTLDVGLTWNNIFNVKKYKYVRYSDLDTYVYNFRLRPSNVMANVSFKF